MGEIQIREFNFPADYARVMEFWKSIEKGIVIGRSDTPEEIQKKISRDPDLFLLAEADDEIIGTVMGAFDGRRGQVYHFAISAPHRRQGLGSMLMNEFESRLRKKGCLKCYLLVTRGNEEALSFYESLGWREMTHDRLYGKEFYE